MQNTRLLSDRGTHGQEKKHQLDALIVTNRPIVHALFHGLANERSHDLDDLHISLRVHSTTLLSKEIDINLSQKASLIIIDTMPDIEMAIQACQFLQSQHVSVPIVGLFCCPRHVEVRQWRALAAAGVYNMIDMSAPLQNFFTILETIAQGGSAISLQFHNNEGVSPKDLVNTTIARKYAQPHHTFSENDEKLLELVSRGTADQEIGENLCLSPHTVKHRIERLRNQLGVSSRTELAAWAGYHGFYTVSEAG